MIDLLTGIESIMRVFVGLSESYMDTLYGINFEGLNERSRISVRLLQPLGTCKFVETLQCP